MSQPELPGALVAPVRHPGRPPGHHARGHGEMARTMISAQISTIHRAVVPLPSV
jgi:hypothetical protein